MKNLMILKNWLIANNIILYVVLVLTILTDPLAKILFWICIEICITLLVIKWTDIFDEKK